MSRPKATKLLKELLAPERSYAVGAILSAFISVLASLAVPILLGAALDVLIGKEIFGIHSLRLILILLLVSIGIATLFQWLQGVLSARLTFNVVLHLRNNIFSKIDKLSVETLELSRAGNISSLLVNDADLVGDGLLQGAQQFFIGISTIVGTMIIMLLLSLPIALVVIVLTPFSILVTAYIAKHSYANFQKERNLQAAYAEKIEEIYTNKGLLQAFNYELPEAKKVLAINKNLYRAGEASQFAGSLTNPGTRFVNNVVYALVALIGCLSVLTPGSTLTVGIVQSFLSYASQYSKPFYEITGVLTQLQAALASIERISSFLDLPEMPLVHSPKHLPKPLQGKLSFENVSFSYAKEAPALSNISFVAPAGTHIALVGHTGCGKTTLISLLLDFISPDSGTICIDDVNTQTISKTELRDSIAMVSQDSWIFSGTIFENIAFGKDGATKADVIRAAEQTQAARFIGQLENGYDTYIDSTSNVLSEGQKQLVSITRAYLKDAPILVLDEATSSIDTRTELLVQNALEKLMSNRTSITVAHRLSTIKKADIILVMDQGRIIERGNQQELLAANAAYAELYRSQWEGAEL